MPIRGCHTSVSSELGAVLCAGASPASAVCELNKLLLPEFVLAVV